MAWSPPATYVGGQLIGASDLNLIRDNLLAIFGTTGHMTSVTIDTGGLTISAGNLGVGSSAISQYGLIVAGPITSSGGSALGIAVSPTLTASANSDVLIGMEIIPTYTVAGHTGIASYGILLQSVVSGAANNYGLYIGTPSGGSTSNVGLYVAGGGAVVAAGGLTVGLGGINITGTGTFNSAVTIASGLTISAGGAAITGDITGTGELYGASATTGMTTGFVRISAANGAPSGTPTTVAGRAAIYYDASANQICVWNGVWKKTVALT